MGSPAEFYDRMDEVMRAVWGEHLHHGLWLDGCVSVQIAAEAMVRKVGAALDLAAGSRVMDVGCGYGATGLQLKRECGYEVEGVTISAKQQQHAVLGSCVLLGDWMEGIGGEESVDGVVAIESLEHMPDVERAVAEMARVLRPRGRVVLACWVRVAEPSWLERRWWLDPIRERGGLGGQGSEDGIRDALEKAGFFGVRVEDLSAQAAPTWVGCWWRGLGLAVREPGLFRRLGWWNSVRFGLVLPRIISAYRMGLLRYVVISATR